MPEDYRNSSYIEFGEMHGPGRPEMRPWIDWFRALGIPSQQVDHKGWVVRDVARKTVTVKVLWWPEDHEPDMVDQSASTYAKRDDNGNDVRYSTFTVQLDEAPPPFPEPYFTKEEAEDHARRSLTSLRSRLATVGEISEDDRPRVADIQHHIDAVRRCLDQVDAQREYRDGDPLRVGVTWRPTGEATAGRIARSV